MLRKYFSSVVLISAFSLLACGAEVGGGGSGGGGGSASSSSSSSSGSGGAGGASFALSCFDMSVVYPGVSKACTVAADCAVTMHPINCCGSMAAIGLDKDDVAAIAMLEQECGSKALCDCPALPTTTEDGKSAEDVSLIQVKCEMGTCSSFLP